jgi:hypothetical protein
MYEEINILMGAFEAQRPIKLGPPRATKKYQNHPRVVFYLLLDRLIEEHPLKGQTN